MTFTFQVGFLNIFSNGNAQQVHAAEKDTQTDNAIPEEVREKARDLMRAAGSEACNLISEIEEAVRIADQEAAAAVLAADEQLKEAEARAEEAKERMRHHGHGSPRHGRRRHHAVITAT